MNIAVVSLKDLIKYTMCFIVIIIIIVIGISVIKKEEINNEKEEMSTGFLNNLVNSSFLICLKTEIPLTMRLEESTDYNEDTASNKILNTELALMYSLEEYDDTEVQESNQQLQESENNEAQNEDTVNNIEVQENQTTEVISENNINATYTNEGRNVQVNNQTDYDITNILNNSNYEINNKTKFIIYHTHTCESYTPSESYNYEMTGSYRTTDLNYTVSRVGDELAKNLESYGKTVIHEKTYHDYPSYNGSYGRSLTTMQGVLEQNSDAEIMIDLHRDAVRK